MLGRERTSFPRGERHREAETMEQTKAAAGESESQAAGNEGILYRARPHLLALFWPCALLAAAAALTFYAERHVAGLGLHAGFRGEQAASFEAACRGLLAAVAIVFALNVLATIVECGTTAYVVT